MRISRRALLSEDIRLTCHVHGARDLRETRICIIDTVLEKKESINYQFQHRIRTTTSDIRAR